MKTRERPPFTRERKRNWFTAGVAAGGWLACRMMLHLLYFPLGAVLLLWGVKKGNRQRRRTWLVMGAAAAMLWVGLYSLVWYAPAMRLWGQERSYQGVVTDYPRRISWGWRVPLRLRTGAQGRGLPVELETERSCAQMKPGDRIELTAILSSPGNRYPERLHTNAANGIFACVQHMKEYRLIPAEKIPLRYWPKAAHHALRQRILKRWRGEEAGLLLALLTGDQDELTEPFATQLSRSGLRHIAAVSGLHVGVLMGLLLLLPGERRSRQLLAAAALVVFCLVTGGRPPVVRATVMGLALLLGPFLRRDAEGWASLRTALLLLMLWNPFWIESVSLQLSFAAVAGILVFTKPLYRYFMGGKEQKRHEKLLLRLRRGVSASLALSLGALVFTTPLVAWYFDTISLASPLSNLVTVWAVELFFVLGAVSALLGGIFPPALLLSAPAHWLFAYLHWMVEFFSYLPLSAVSTHVKWYRWWLLAVYGVIVLLWRRKRLRRRGALFVPLLVMLLLLCAMSYRMELVGGGLGVQAVDVGQGQSILLFSQQEAAAVDCGGSNAGNALANAMNDALEGKLDLLVFTHFDNDHINGLADLLERVEVAEIAVPDVNDDGGGRERVEKLAREKGIPLRTVTQDETVTIGEAALQVFAPVGEGEDNDSGLSVLAERGSFSVLITGDMGEEAEQALLEREKLGHVTALVAGHHGSRYSTGEALLEAVQPEVVLISCAENNRYGHPHQETLERLEKAGCPLERTDLDGTLTVAAQIREKE